jgi:hypothetical protein
MLCVYNSDIYAVMQFGPIGTHDNAPPAPVAGFEIVDKAARREVFLEGALAERFREGVEALVREGVSSPDALDEYIARFSGLAQHPLALH